MPRTCCASAAVNPALHSLPHSVRFHAPRSCSCSKPFVQGRERRPEKDGYTMGEQELEKWWCLHYKVSVLNIARRFQQQASLLLQQTSCMLAKHDSEHPVSTSERWKAELKSRLCYRPGFSHYLVLTMATEDGCISNSYESTHPVMHNTAAFALNCVNFICWKMFTAVLIQHSILLCKYICYRKIIFIPIYTIETLISSMFLVFSCSQACLPKK